MGELNIKPSQDDLDQRQNSQRPARTKTTGRNSSGGGGGSSAGLLLLIVLLAVGSAAGSFFLWSNIQSLNQRMNASVQSLTQAEKALADLRLSMSARGDSLAETEGSIVADIELLDSEVRKLWDLANKRNKVNIAKLDKKVGSFEQEVGGLEKSLASSSADLKSLSGAQSELSKKLTDVQESTITLRKIVTEHQSKLNQVQTFADNTGSLDDRITELELAIKAIDTHRRQINVRLEKITKDIWDLENAVAKPQ